MLEALQHSPLAWAILAIVTIASLAYTVVCQHKNKKRLQLSYVVESNELIQNRKSEYEKISISYDGQAINNLSVSKIVLWNSGNSVLNASDIIPTKEISICVTEGNRILDIDILHQTESTNSFSIISIDDHTAKISFDYAEVNDGIVIQVMHTGKSRDISISCKIKGGQLQSAFNANLRGTNTYFKKLVITFFVFSIIMLIMAGILILGDALVQNHIITNEKLIYWFSFPLNNATVATVFKIAMVALSSLYVFLSTTFLRRELRIGIPSKLKKGFSTIKDDRINKKL